MISKDEERALSIGEKPKLLLHLILCKFCRWFLKETTLVSEQVKNLPADERLSDEEKRKIEDALNQRRRDES